MPRVPLAGEQNRINPERGPVVFRNTRGASLDAFGGREAEALQGLGQDLGRGSDILTNEILNDQERINKRKAKELETEFRNRIRAITFGDGSDANKGYFSLTGAEAVDNRRTAEEDIEAVRQEIIGQGDNQQLVEYLETAVNYAHSRAMDDIARFAQRQEIVAEEQAHGARLNSLVQDAARNYTDSAAIAEAKAAGVAEITSFMEGRSEEEIVAATEAYLTTVNSEVIREMVFANKFGDAKAFLNRVEKQMQRETVRDLGMEIDRFEKAERLERERRDRERRAKLKASLDRRLRDNLASIRHTGRPLGNFTRAELADVYGEEGSQIVQQEINDELAYFEATQDAMFTTMGEDAALLESLAPAGEGFADEVQRYEAFKRVLSDKYKMLGDDPAAYVEKFSPGVREAYANADTTEELQEAIDMSLQAQAELGLPPFARRAVPKSRTANMIAAFNGAEDGQARADWARQQAEAHGEYWPRVYGDLVRDGLPRSAAVLASLTGSGIENVAAVELAEAQEIGRETLKKNIGNSDDVDTVITGVAAALEDFRASLANVPNGGDIYDQWRSSAEELAMYRVFRGEDPSTAAQTAADSIANNRYNFYGTFRVPAALDGDTIAERATNYRQSQLQNMNLVTEGARDPRLPAEEAQRQFTRAISENGYWLTNHDESGLQLVDPYGAAVLQREPGERLSEKALKRFNLSKEERKIVNYHRKTLDTGASLFTPQGQVTVNAVGPRIPSGPFKGKFAAVPGFVDGKVLTEGEAYDYWKDEIDAGKWPIYDSGEELNQRAQQIHRVMELESDRVVPVEVTFDELLRREELSTPEQVSPDDLMLEGQP